jgi:DNA (cytosine-5)-methyltransferase 1
MFADGPRIGSLFSGYGGLDLAVAEVLGGTVAWHCENDTAASRVLAHHWPDVPNLGDITAVDWSTVEPVDVLTGGFPCQDVSHAGRRAGLGPGTRTGLWSAMADAIDHLRPALVIAENVRGLLSARAASDVEPCPWCVGDDEDQPALRALGAVLADLADLGYDAVWHGIRAADVGAPHGRFRVLIAARPANSHPVGEARGRDEPRVITPGSAPGTVLEAQRGTGRGRGAPAPDTVGDPVREQPVPVAGDGGAPVPELTGASTPAYPHVGGLGADQRDLRPGQPDPDRRATADSVRDGRERDPQCDRPTVTGQHRAPRPDADGLGLDWGAYAAAVRRWELILGRLAPAPTEPGTKGQPRLAPAFVEWLMGLPVGWVTAVPDVGRNDQLRIPGNGVVPQQAAAALVTLGLTAREAPHVA